MADALGNFGEGCVWVGPLGDGFCACARGDREGLEFAEGGGFPVAGFEQNGDDAGLSLIVALESLLHFGVVAVVGGEEVGADQEQDDVGGVEVGGDRVCPVGSGGDVAIVPGGDDALFGQQGEVGGEVVAQGFVFVGVGEEEGERSGGSIGLGAGDCAFHFWIGSVVVFDVLIDLLEDLDFLGVGEVVFGGVAHSEVCCWSRVSMSCAPWRTWRISIISGWS